MNRTDTWWVRIALFNLGIVALIGAVMRYKIGFELPLFNQKFLQEAHSHFAFTGWISHTLFFLIVKLIRTNLEGVNLRRYHLLIVLNLFSAYGMLIAFAIQGYAAVSLVFSTLSVVVAYVFSFMAWRDAGKLPAEHPSRPWIRAAVFFGVLSTVGTMVLSQMMATRQFDQTTYLGSIYFYLHFQYNGWFLFGCIALFFDQLRDAGLEIKRVRKAFWCLFLAGLPAYFLSTLWAHLPAWLYVLVVAAAILQLVGWWYLFGLVRSRAGFIASRYPRVVLMLWWVAGLAFTLKLILQLGSVHPEISHLAFGFRPIVIAYLHLVLLLIISVFLLAFLAGTGYMHMNKVTRVMLVTFALGAVGNEVVLAIQGIGAFSYTVIPLANELLFGVGLVLWLSATILFAAQWKSRSA